MGLLTSADRAQMLANTVTIYDDWSQTITVRNLATDQSANEDELGWKQTNTPSYTTSYTVRALVYPASVLTKTARDNQTDDVRAGLMDRTSKYVKINAADLGVNQAPTTNSELVISSVTYRVDWIDFQANQYLIGAVEQN